MKKASVFLCFALLLGCISCSDSDLQKVTKSMLVVSTATTELQNNVIVANKQSLIDDATTGRILQVCAQINVAVTQVDSVLGAIKKIDSASRSNIVVLLTQISQALNPAELEFIAGIKDAAVKQKIEGGFVLLRSAVSSVQVIVAAAGG